MPYPSTVAVHTCLHLSPRSISSNLTVAVHRQLLTPVEPNTACSCCATAPARPAEPSSYPACRWSEVWHLLQALQAECAPFQPVSRSDVLAELCSVLLRAGQSRLARQLLSGSGSGSGSAAVPQQQAEQVVLEAAAEYFQSAQAADAPEIHQVRLIAGKQGVS